MFEISYSLYFHLSYFTYNLLFITRTDLSIGGSLALPTTNSNLLNYRTNEDQYELQQR